MDLTERLAKLSPRQRKLLALKLEQRNISIDILKIPITREPPAPDRQGYPLSLQQERLWFIHQLTSGNSAYNIVNPTKLKGKLNVPALEQSINEIIQRRDILRTVFIGDRQAPAQVILHHLSLALEVIDLKNFSAEEQEREINRFIRDESLYVFDLTAGPLLRTKLFVLNENEHMFLLVIHHMICDGTSIRIFIKELVQLYEAISQRKSSPLPELPIRYVDFACWQRQWFRFIKNQEEFWLQQFKGEIPVLDLPLDYPRPATQDFEGNMVLFHLSPQETTALREMALKRNSTLYVVLLSFYTILLAKLSGKEDIIVGTPTAGRRHPGVQKLIGMFVNTLVLRNYPHPDKTCNDFLEEVKTRTLKAFENQEYQYEDLLGQVRINRDNRRNPLFDVMFLLVNVDSEEIKARGLELENYPYENKTSKFDLTLRAWEQGELLHFSCEYAVKLFKETTIRRMIDYFKRIITSVIENPAGKIKEIEIISPEKKRELLSQFNRNLQETFDIDIFQHKLCRSFREYPDRIAIEYGALQVIYSQLDKKSTSISHWMRHHGIERGSFTGIYLDDQVEFITLAVGILKAGCVFVPLDTELPVKRIRQMAQLVHLQPVFTTAARKAQLIKDWQDRGHQIDFIEIDDTFYDCSSLLPSPKLGHEIEYKSDEGIYIYFTSGTSGLPRAILGKNISLLQFVNWEIDTFGIIPGFRISQLSSVGFDAFLRNVFTPLCAGGVICIPAKREIIIDSEVLIDWIHRSGIHLIHCVPAVFRLFNGETVTPAHFRSLKYVLIAGDIIYPHELERWYRTFANRIRLVNCYGTTETTMFKTYYLVQPGDTRKERIPVGQCMRGASIIILDEQGNVCDRGIAGEIYIRSPYSTRGYYNDPQYNHEKFIANPVSDDPSDLIFKTGDLGRQLEDGNIEFLGRKDSQVKIRGVRIELREIENRLLCYEGIFDCVAAVRSDIRDKVPPEAAEHYLCAYIAPAKTISGSKLREYLQHYFPDYMIPSFFVFLDKIPLTTNLKIDYAALPAPELKPTENFAAPATLLEQKLAGIWAGVLNVGKDMIGIDSNFFELGGHSLKAANLAAQIHKEFQVKVPLADLFKIPTIRGLSQYIQGAVEHRYTALKPVEKKDYYPLSSAQKRLYILNRMEMKSTAYNMPQVISLPGTAGVEKLKNIFMKLIRRHESLRTSFEMVNDEPVQRIHENEAITFVIDYFETAGDQVQERFVRHFDLSRAPLVRVGLIKIDPLNHQLLVDMHHIISDGISLALLRKDFIALYENRELNPLRIHYNDYAEWQNSSQQKKAIKKQEEYWLKEFNDSPSVLNLPLDYPRPALQSFAGDRVCLEIDNERRQALEKMTKSQDATLFMVLLAAYNVLLTRLTGQEDIIVGTPTAGRPHADLEHVIGMFVNTLALRNFPAAEKPFHRFLAELKQRTLEAFDHQDYQFEDLVENITLERDTGRNPVFDVMFSMHNLENTGPDTHGFEAIAPDAAHKSRSEISKFDMTLIAVNNGNKLTLMVEYCTKLFKKETINRFVNYFNRILSIIVENPDILLCRIEILAREEKRQLLYDFNDTGAQIPEEKTLHGLFAEQVERTPHRIAVVENRKESRQEQHISYLELNKRSDYLARQIQMKSPGVNSIIALLLEVSMAMPMGILGILKAGAAYLPIEPEFPRQRIGYMLKDSHTSLLLSVSHFSAEIDFPGEIMDITPFTLPQVSYEKLGTDAFVPERVVNHPNDIVYVMYTSGSTGNPKGVLVRHGNITNQLLGLEKLYPFDESLNHILMAPYTFDPSVQQMFLPLITGGRLLLLSNSLKNDARQLLNLILTHRLNIFNTVPSFMNALLDHIERDDSIGICFKYIILAGEVFSRELYIKLTGKCYADKIINIYGPTEATINTTWYECGTKEKNDAIPIGRPLMNYQVLILDKRMNLLPVGVVGEICIAGKGLARGYLNQPELTHEKFIKHPFEKGKRRYLYRTGDLGRWAAEGIIRYRGRIDEQVKIRGMRIELGEIETRLLTHPQIREAVVLTGKDRTGDTYLCAYLVADQQVPAGELSDYLSGFIPDYMIPSYFVRIDEIPLTANGKIDKKNLPEPQTRQARHHYTPPQDEIQREMVDIWEEVLGIDRNDPVKTPPGIGIDDNFFELGGHSLKAIVLTARIHKKMNARISLAEFFNNPSIRKLSARISIAAENRCKDILAVEKRDFYSLSSAQRRLYFLQQMDVNSTAYNIPQVTLLEGILDKTRLRASFHRLIRKHESLRTSFPIVDEEPVQKIHEKPEFEIEFYDRCEHQEQVTAAITDFIRPFDLSSAPLLRAGLLEMNMEKDTETESGSETEENQYLLLVDLHHIISDEVSNDIFIKDLLRLYRGNEILELRLQYKDFSQWQNKRIESGAVRKQEEYWLKTFSGEIPLLRLPTDYERPEVLQFEGRTTAFAIDSALYNRIKELTWETGTTLNIFLLAAYNVLLSKYTGQETILVGTVIAGRRHADLQNIIGFFVNMLAIKTHPSQEQTFAEFLKEVKEISVKAYENQDYQFEELVSQLKLERESGRHPLIDTVFVLQNRDEHPEDIRAVEKSGLKASPYRVEHNVSHFDLMLHATAGEDSLSMVIEFSNALFKQATMEILAHAYKELLEQVVKNITIRLKDIAIRHEIFKECTNRLQDQELAFEF